MLPALSTEGSFTLLQPALFTEQHILEIIPSSSRGVSSLFVTGTGCSVVYSTSRLVIATWGLSFLLCWRGASPIAIS